MLNIILDPIFIYTLDMGVAGAAIATGISQIVSTAIYLFYIFRKKSVIHFRLKDYCFSRSIMSEILKIGIPTLIFQLLTSLSIALINDKAKGYGDSVIAAMGTVTRVISVGSLMVFGFYTVYSSLFLAMGKAKEGFILGACRQGICFVPVILILPIIGGKSGVLYAQPISDIISAVITAFMAIHLRKELSAVNDTK